MSTYSARALVTPAQASNPAARISCLDDFGIATAASDYIFDAANPRCFASGSLPSSGASLPLGSVYGVAITAAGSGGTDGEYDLVFSGGGGSGAAGRFTVDGGAVVDAWLTAKGSGYTSAVGVNGGANTPSGATFAASIGTLLNLARDVQPVLSRTVETAAALSDTAARPTWSANGVALVNGSSAGLTLARVGVAGHLIAEPKTMGLIDYLEFGVIKASAWPSLSALTFGIHGNSGIQFTSGVPVAKENAGVIGAAVPTGKIALVGKRVRFEAGGATSIIGYVGVDGIVTATSIAGKASASYAAPSAGQTTRLGSAGGAAYAMTGKLHYAHFEWIGLSGRSDDDVLAIMQRVLAIAEAKY